jgi:peptidoglycan pentaglycine glycine transferase (the first glycine)
LLNELKYIAQKHHAIFLRIEPPILHAPAIGSILLQHGFEPSKFTNQPRATLILDLDKDLVDIMAQMKRSAQRIRHAERCGVIVRRGDQRDLSAFCGLMQETSARCGFSSRTCDYYEEQWDAFSRRDEAVMLLAYGEGQLLGGRMSFRFAEHAASLHACSSLVHSELRANWLLVWEEIKWARALGCRTFDLWGIPNEVGEAAYEGRELPTSGPSSELWGVYQFKRGFTQNVVYYLGAYDYIYAPLLYRPVMQILSNEHLDHLTAKIDSIKSRRMIAKK